jgi:hypothetical protein
MCLRGSSHGNRRFFCVTDHQDAALVEKAHGRADVFEDPDAGLGALHFFGDHEGRAEVDRIDVYPDLSEQKLETLHL